MMNKYMFFMFLFSLSIQCCKGQKVETESRYTEMYVLKHTGLYEILKEEIITLIRKCNKPPSKNILCIESSPSEDNKGFYVTVQLIDFLNFFDKEVVVGYTNIAGYTVVIEREESLALFRKVKNRGKPIVFYDYPPAPDGYEEWIFYVNWKDVALLYAIYGW